MPEPALDIRAASPPPAPENAELARAEQSRARRRLIVLALITIGAAMLATACLLAQFNVNAILYKGF